MTPQNSRANAAQEAERGREALAAARHLLEGDFFNDSIARAYYAAFHFARALLLLKGLEPKTHQGTIQLVALHYVRPGLLAEEIASYLARLETDREISDYSAATKFSKEEAQSKIRLAEEFILACQNILGQLGVKG